MNKKILFRLLIAFIIVILYASLIYGTIIDAKKSPYSQDEKVYDVSNNQKKILIAFRNDDISARTNVTHEQSVIDIFWKYKITQTFAIIPNVSENPEDYNNENFHPLSENKDVVEALKRWEKEGKIEFALHGYTHQRSKGSSGEFDHLFYKEQFEKIKRGKEILDNELNANVSIFAPPWNQADKNTMITCVNSRIPIFSGYMGGEPTKGITFVNTNAVLTKGIGLPQVEDVLKYAKNGSRITFVIVFYHSNTDFNESSDYTYLNNLLMKLTNDSTIEISSIGEIAEKYRDFLPAYNQAGLNIKEADDAKRRAKPYILGYRKTSNFLGKDLSIDELYDKAFVAYWSGNYEHASKLAIEIIEKCADYIVNGRIMAVIGSGIAFLIFVGVLRYKKKKPSFRHYRNFLLVLVMPFIVIGCYLNIFTPVSALRIAEFNLVSGLFLGGIATLSILFFSLKSKRNIKTNKKTIATVFFTDHPDTVGNAIRLKIYECLGNNYNLIVLTNHVDFVKEKIEGDIIYVQYFKNFPIISDYLFWLKCGLKLLFLKYDLLFLFHAESPISFFNLKRPFLCHIHQSHEVIIPQEKQNCKSFKDIISLILKKIHVSVIFKGVRRADYNFAVSEQLRNFFINNGVDKEKIEYLPHGVDLELFTSNNRIPQKVDIRLPKNRFIIMYTGWVNEKRGLELLLFGTNEIKKVINNMLLILIGCEKEYIKKINTMGKQMNIHNNVIALGRVDYSLIPYYLEKADLCVSILERNETYSISPPQKLFEYFAMGKPVIANKIPTHTDYIKDGYNGFIINDVKGFRDAALKLYNDKELYAQMSKNARETAKKYDLKKIEKRLGKVIKKLVE
jgi:glycosyltransferase involved in cell wall biosynthesis